MKFDESLNSDAEAIQQDIRFIHRALLRAVDADKQRANLALPQRLVLTVLAQSSEEGLTLKELCEHMGLAQSTISSLVDRLEGKGLVRRSVEVGERRLTRIVLAEDIQAYLEPGGVVRRVSPLLKALSKASADERKTILDGLMILRRFLDDEDETRLTSLP